MLRNILEFDLEIELITAFANPSKNFLGFVISAFRWYFVAKTAILSGA